MSDRYLSKLFDLQGKVAIVSGASRGIGAAIANGLASAGAHTFALGRSDKATEELSSAVCYTSCDISDNKVFQQVSQNLDHQYGKIDIFVNAVGISIPITGQNQSLESFRKTLDINLTAAFTCIQSLVPYMKKANGGSIVNVTSIGSVLGFPGNPGYVASKGGLQMLTKALAVDLASDNIRVNNIAPGYIHTNMTDQSFSDPEKHDARLQNMLIKRWGKPEDIVGAAIYLSSAASAYVTGTDIFVDGGWTSKGL